MTKNPKTDGRDGAPPAADATDDPGTATEASRSASAEGGAGTPPQPVSRISKDDRTPTKTPCLCGCGGETRSLFARGHDVKMFRVAREYLTEGKELTDEQREYLESSGKMERVRARLAEEDARRREAETRKSLRKESR